MKFAWLLLAAVSIEAAELRGTVRSPSGPVAGARVDVVVNEPGHTIAQLTQTTGAAGTFSFTVQAGERIEVSVAASPPEGLSMATDSVYIPLRRDTEVRLMLTPFVRVSGAVAGANGNMTVELHSMTSSNRLTSPASPAFSIDVPADIYAVFLRRPNGPPYLARQNVDARNGNVGGIVLTPGLMPETIVFDDPPDATKITIEAPNADGVAVIRSAAGTVPPLSAVLVTNLHSWSTRALVSDADGSFRTDLFAPPGSSIQIRCDRTGLFLFEIGTAFDVPPATILHVPAPAGRAALVSFLDPNASSPQVQPNFITRTGTTDPGRWTFETAWPAAAWTPSSTVRIDGKLTLFSKNLRLVTDLAAISIQPSAGLTALFDRNGVERSKGTFMSSVMTPTGLPIERSGPLISTPSRVTCGALTRRSDERADADCRVDLDLPASLSPAIYQPFVTFHITGIPSDAVYFDIPQTMGSATSVRQSYFPAVRVGAPAAPRLFWMLLMNEFSNGSRGTVAVEDRGKFSFASHVVMNTPRLIVPLHSYRLEPFVPMISSTPHLYAEVPEIAFKFPSGSLRVRVTRPDGTIDDLGSAPFRQSASHGNATRGGTPISTVSKHVADLYQLSTNDPRFRYTFPAYGNYRIEMTGTIEDLYGNVYSGGGTYEVTVARTLDIDTAVIAGTPFHIGDAFTPGVKLDPAVDAEVDVTLTVLPGSDAAKKIVRTWRGRANRFGVFHGEAFPFTAAGEYRVDVNATWTSPSGEIWSGAMTAGSVIATPSSPIVTHGRRGFDSQETIGHQWFFVRDDRAGPDHVMLPFHSGDVMWLEDTGPPHIGLSADTTMLSLHDPNGVLGTRVRSRAGGNNWQPPSSIDDRIAAGEIPLFSSIADGSSVSFEPDRADQWGYAYNFVERPGLHVRELVVEDSQSGNGYWRFSENYHFQLGNGINGDLPNDFKFQFGGAVWRDLTDGFRYYGAYASLFVLLPPTGRDEGRVFPPFDPTGGPLLKLKGKTIDLFFHPTAVRPGTILVQGETASFAGYSAPTLPSKITVDVTSPTGRVRTIRGQASKIGWFHDPGYDFAVDEPGVWKAKVRITFDGATSNGQLAAPFPAGDVLGSREGEFYFYVVRGDTAPLSVAAAAPAAGQPGAAAPTQFTFTVTPPTALTNMQLTYTTTMPGFILEEGTTSALAYTYDAPRLAHDFPNLDLFDSDGFAGVDTITISLLLSGTDAGGKRRHFARQIVIQGEEVQMPEQKATPATPRRRASKR